jgi:predicted NBD/HSP70 family sugar kinase
MTSTIATRPQVASSEDVRDNNRRIVLNLIRTRQPLSRADLARLSGMQRSTISLIVEQLLEERWVLEGAMGRLPRGRRPTFLQLNNDRVIIAIDIRPIQTTVAIADVNGRFTQQLVTPTPEEPAESTTAIIHTVRALMRSSRGKKIEGIGVTLPGRYDRRRQRFAFAPNLKWRDYDLAPRLSRATGLEVAMENAANACVLATVWFGMDTPKNLVAVTVSEGIGTGIMVNGQLVHGMNDMAGEFGHVPLDPKGPRCSCGSRGCWEVFGSNRAALRYYGGGRSRGRGVDFQQLLSRAEEGDQRAGLAIDRMARYLGVGLRPIMAGLAPERIVISGDLTQSWARIAPIIETEVQSQVLPGGRVPRIVAAEDGGLARLRGAVALVLQKHFGDPLWLG